MAYSRRACREQDGAVAGARCRDQTTGYTGYESGGTTRQGPPSRRWRSPFAGRGLGGQRLATLQRACAGHGSGRAAPRLRPDGDDGDGQRQRQDDVGDLAGHHRSVRSSKHLCAGQRLYLQARGRYRQPRKSGPIASGDQAQATRDLGQVTWNRDSTLVQKGWVTQQQGDTDRLNLKAQDAAVAVAQANIKAQTAQVAVLHQQKDYQSVTAPFDGVITGTFLFTLMQSDTLRIQLYVPQDEAFGIGPGVDAVIRVPELPGRDFPGKVTRIADALQPGTRTLLTEIDVPNPDHALSPGVYCTVELKIPRKTSSLVLPSEAIIFNAKGLSVAVVEDGTAHMHNVNVVRDFGTTIEVNSGVKDGDQVILAPPVDLADGQKVQVRPKPPT
ncbi:MAG: efflux RND transporter periplasmic adaptor subunit [Xanthobacteraceae bacterium]